MADSDSAALNEVKIGSSSGKLDVDIGTVKAAYSFSIVVKSERTAGNNDDQVVLRDVKVTVRCGPDSTAITPPALTLQEATNGNIP